MRRRPGTAWLLAGAIALLVAANSLLAPRVQAQVASPQISESEARAVQAVIQAQLDAFAADDAERAFSFAAPAIRRQFGTAERFAAMVRSGYAAVIRPAAVVFLKAVRDEGVLIQGVQLTDADGATWVAAYAMQRQSDGNWRIAGVQLVRGAARLT